MLIDCVLKDYSQTELFILGPAQLIELARGPRDRNSQALLPITGEVKGSGELDEVLDNEDCKSIISVLGIGVELDDSLHLHMQGLRYGKIFVVTDDSPAGLHIRTQVITFLHTYMFELLNSGRVFIPEDIVQSDITKSEFESQLIHPRGRQHKQILPTADLIDTLSNL